MWRDGKDLATIQRALLSHRPIGQVVEFFYSKRGQELKLKAMAEREEREPRRRRGAKARGYAAADDDTSPKGYKRKGFGDGLSGPGRPARFRAAAKEMDGYGAHSGGAIEKKRFGARVFANVSVRADAEVRLRLRVKKVDLRRYGDKGGAAGDGSRRLGASPRAAACSARGASSSTSRSRRCRRRGGRAQPRPVPRREAGRAV